MGTKWKRHLTRDANILCKYLIMRCISLGPRFVFTDWDGMHNQLWTWKNGETGIHFLSDEMERFNTFLEKTVIGTPAIATKYRAECKTICDDVASSIHNLSQDVSSETGIDRLLEKFDAFCVQYQRLGETII